MNCFEEKVYKIIKKVISDTDRLSRIAMVCIGLSPFVSMGLGRLIYYNDGQYWKQELLYQYNQMPLERSRIVKEEFTLQPGRVNYKLSSSLHYAEDTDYIIDIIDRHFEEQDYSVNKSSDNYENEINHWIEYKGYIIWYTSVNKGGNHLICVDMWPSETYNFPARFNW